MNTEIYKLAGRVIKVASKNGLTIATAESCTGGGISAAITAIPGSSNVYIGGIISYADAAKINLLGVAKHTIKKHGAVSGQTAIAMAEGACKALSTDLAISVTGIAGPTGGSADKPVGTVWIGLAMKSQNTTSRHFLFADNGRENVRKDTIVEALNILVQALSRL